jgi:hypothetical protein
MITRSLLIIALAGATAISLLPTLTPSAYSIRIIHHHDPNYSPFLPIPFSPPCTPTSMLLDSVSVLSMQYNCSIPNTLHPNVALSSNLMASQQLPPNSPQQLPPNSPQQLPPNSPQQLPPNSPQQLPPNSTTNSLEVR